MSSIKRLSEVVDWRLCIGCGACAYICTDQNVRLFDFPAEGIRPIANINDCGTCQDCLKVCPALENRLSNGENTVEEACVYEGLGDAPLVAEWGPILQIWEGYAVDPEIRFQGSSGGALTAIGAYCLEKEGMHGVLHIGQSIHDPLRNSTRLSRSREELLSAAGSRYAPASVCDHLEWVEEAPGLCAIIGKPGEITAVRNAQRIRPALNEKVGVTLSFFCAESPSTAGTLALLKKMKVESKSVVDIRYRGLGWPGYFAAKEAGESEPRQKLTYQESWAFLQAFRPWSVQVWPDGTGEHADISCGDPWYEEPDGVNPGFSLVVVRTVQGRKIIEGAVAAGYLKLRPAESWKLVKSQQGLIKKKGAVWGRLMAMRIFRLPAPQLSAQGLFRCWLTLSLKEKLKSTVGSIRRILARKLYKPLILDKSTAVPIEKSIT